MNPRTITAWEGFSRRSSICAKLVMCAAVNPLFAITIIATFYVAGMAMAAVMSADFSGRWVSEKHKLTLDVSRCGSGWCGVEVTNATSCGSTVLRLDSAEQGNETVRFSGHLQLAAETQPYGVEAILVRRGDGLALLVTGHTGGIFQFGRRTFDFRDVFVRINDSVCRPDAKVS